MVDNVLWIITDDQMRWTLSRMPKTRKRLVRKGVEFSRGYAAVPWCGPARASILTSRYPHDHGCFTNATHRRFVAQGHDRDTVATRMRAAGYDTGYFGKYMNGMGRTPTYVAPGWRRWVVSTIGDRETVNVDGSLRELESRQAVERFVVSRLRRFIRRHRDTEPWFAVWGPTTPHFPYTPTDKHRHDFDDVTWDPPALNEADMSDKPSWMRNLPRQDREEMRRVLEGKLEELRDLDDQIGRLLTLLWKTGQLERTWIFLVSDNGYLLGEHRLFHKEQPYEESSGIPYVVRGPGVKPGRRRALVSQVDLMPTTLEIAGLDPDAGRELSGRSMLRPLRTGSWRRWRRRLLVEHPYREWAMLREDDTAYIEHYTRDEWELYDLESDPHQLNSRRGADTTEHARRLALLRETKGSELRAREE